jgi:GH15 family glucan-1,4-alpha-glucosidase
VSSGTDLDCASVEVMARGQHPSGAYVASPTCPTYRYSWIQDGAFIALAMDEAGEHRSAAAFHRWVAGVVGRRRSTIERLEREPPHELMDAEILHTRYTVEGEEATEPGPTSSSTGTASGYPRWPATWIAPAVPARSSSPRSGWWCGT